MGTKNNTESFVSSVISSSTSTAFSSSNYQFAGTVSGGHQQQHLVANLANSGRVITNCTPKPAVPLIHQAAVGKHRLPMQLSRPPTTGSIGVSVITPAVGVNQSPRKEVHFKPQHHMQKIQNVRNTSDYGRNNATYSSASSATKLVSPTTGVTITPINSPYMPGKSKIVPPSATASIVYSHTQHLPKYISSSRFLVNTDKGDVYINDDGTIGEMPDKRAQYSNHMPPDYQYVLQDHSYSQLPESPPPPTTPPAPPQRATINGLNRISSAVTPTKVSLNNNRLVTVGGAGATLTNNVSGSGSRLNNQQNLLTQANSSMNSYSSVSAIVNSVATNIHNNTATSVIAVNPKKNLSSVPKSLLKVGALDRRDESDLSEDDRIPDPHGEETETAPEAEGEEESVTRCICDFQHDDGYMISCDKCLAWQHVVCMGIDWHQIPDEYQCEKCQPRYIDKKKAVEVQKKKIAEKLCVGVNDDSDSSDAPAPNVRGVNKNQTKRKYKGRRTQNKRKNVKENIKDGKQKRNVGVAKKRQISEASFASPPVSPSLSSNSSMSIEKKKQLLMERKQMLLEKKQITKKRSMRKQALSTKRNFDKSKVDEDFEHRSTGAYTDKEEDSDHSIQQVREWVDRYEEAVTNHYSQELRARLSAVQVNGVHSDLKYTTTLRSVEKCKTSLLSTGGKIVLATCSLSPNQPIIELRGKYMWTGAGSFKQNNISPSTPYVFYYRLPKQDIEICVDCRTYGNFARFVRRSCKPNSELRHCIRKTSLHLYIIATQSLKKNSEILIGHFSPETANSCVCGSPESCTAAKTPYPQPISRYGDKNSRESQSVRSSSPMISEINSRNKKTPVNSDKGKKRLKEEKKKLTKEKRRGRRRSPSSGTNSDQEESSSRDQSPLAPSKLTVNMWAKPMMNSATESIRNDDQSDNEIHSDGEMPPSPDSDKEPNAVTPTSTTEATSNGCAIGNNDNATTSASDSEGGQTTSTSTPASNETPKQNSRPTRNSDYAKKEKQQLDMPLFFQMPNNHKMTREEKKIQAIMKAFEQMEKSEARKQENQKHRRESTSDAEAYSKKTPCRKGLKSRKSVDETKDEKSRRDDDSVKSSRRNSQTEDEDDEKPSIESFNHKLNSMKEEPKNDDSRKTSLVENCAGKIKTETDYDSDAAADKETDNEDENKPNCANDIKKFASPTKISPTYTSPNASPIKVNNRVDEKVDSETDKEAVRDKRKRNEAAALRKTPKIQSSSKSRLNKPTPKAIAVTKPKVLRGKKRKSESGAEDSGEPKPNRCDISERTRSAVQRQKKAATKSTKDEKNDKKNSLMCSPGKFKKAEDAVVSPFSTPPKSRERLDSSSSSGGTPPTPVSDTCLLVAAAVGHLTDFKFPNTKKELMNAWFKEEKKPLPEEEIPNKLTNQEGNNEYAKKRWLRQAISEEGDSSVPRPEEAVSPNGDYGGPLKKRRFARESMSEQTCSSPTANTFAGSNQMSFDDDDDDAPSPDASLYRASEGDGVEAYHPTQLQNEVKPVTEKTDTVKTTESSTPVEKGSPVELDTDDIAANVSRVLSSVLSAVANVENQPPPPPPSRPCTPPRMETKKMENASPPISKKKLSLTEYQKRKSTAAPAAPLTPTDTGGDVVQEVPALAAAPPPTIDPAETVERSSSRSSITSSSCSEEEDNSHAASAQVIARSLMIESRHLSYGPQASALFNSIRSGSLGGTASQTFNSKSNTGPPLPRENLADRLKREFDVQIQEDDLEKNRNMPPPLSPIKIHVQMPPELPLTQKDLHLRLKKIIPPPPPPPLPNIPPPLLPPLPEPPQLFAPYYPYAVPRVPPFFAAPPPPPPPVPPPVPPPLLPPLLPSLLPPPPPPPPPQ